ncbi:MAG: hypothetical protein ACP5N2_04750 [Candidatus Nanoarchaeia archaeon]
MPTKRQMNSLNLLNLIIPPEKQRSPEHAADLTLEQQAALAPPPSQRGFTGTVVGEIAYVYNIKTREPELEVILPYNSNPDEKEYEK